MYAFLKNTSQTLLVKKPITIWTGAREKLKTHCKASPNSTHAIAVAQFNHFNLNRPTVIVKMNNELKQRIQSNRNVFDPIKVSLVFLAKHNIPLRSHRDDAKYINDPNNNAGNFNMLLKFPFKMGNITLQQHFATAPRNATYRSSNIQNQLLSCIGAFIVNNIVREVQRNRFFSILADEVLDVSNIEQMPLCIRYVDSSFIIREKFVSIIRCHTGTSGASISDKILAKIKELNLDMLLCRGQGYDGAGNMSGKYIL